jgi:hypothetical protein
MVKICTPMVVTHTGPHDDALDSHLLCQGVKLRRPPVRVSASAVVLLGRHTFTTSAIPLPWPAGCRLGTLRPPLSVKLAFLGGVNHLA